MNITTSTTSKNSVKIPDKIDILILGGGMSGLELAKHLNNREIENIAIIEVGPVDDCNHINAGEDFQRADEFWKNEDADKYAYRSWQSLSEPHYSKGTCLRRRVGGRSLYWHGVILPIEAEALKYWPAKIVSDLTDKWLDGPSLYTRVESEILAWAEKSYDADFRFKFANFEFKITPQATRIVGDSDRWEAYSPLSYWKEDKDNNLRTIPLIISGYEAVSLIITDGKCIGAKLRDIASDEVHHILADKCVLALGTIENSRLATQALYDLGILIEKKITGLVDHIVQGFNVTIEHDKVPDKLNKLIESHPDTIFFSPSLSGERFNLFFTINKSNFGIGLEAWTMGEQIPSIHTNIAMNAGAIPLSISCNLVYNDNTLIKKEKHELNMFWHEICKNIKIPFKSLDFQAGFIIHARTMGDVHNHIRSSSRIVNYNVPITWISPLGTENHEGSTLPLGEILNDNHEFNKINNLFAIGPSTFPRPGAANPSLTTLALSRRLAYILN